MRVLMSAYACEPGIGSEAGAGWNWALAAARDHEVVVLTRASNREAIDVAITREGISHLEFVYLDLPKWARFWKRGVRGSRVYYFIWQFLVAARVGKLKRSRSFDVVHHITFANMWMPALACVIDAPFVLGPTSGGQRVPRRLYGLLGVRGVLAELLMLAARQVNRWNPLVTIAWKRASVILANNEETLDAFPSRYRQKVSVRTLACAAPEISSGARNTTRKPSSQLSRHTAVCAGRLNRFKGVSLAIKAVGREKDWRLHVVGSGPDRTRLEAIARTERLGERIAFTSWLGQQELWELLRSADALLLPTLKEGASFIAVESQTLRTPVIALDQGGPRALAQVTGSRFELVPVGSEEQCVNGMQEALKRLERKPDRESYAARFGIDGVSDDLAVIYRRAVYHGRSDEPAATDV